MKPIILASSSNYRKQLLLKLGITFTSIAPNIDESALDKESPKQLALRLAQEKAQAIQEHNSKHLIIASDQVASCNNKILGKPKNHRNSIQQLKLQSGQAVQFFTAVCVLDSSSNKIQTEIDICTVYFRKLTEQQIINYVNIEKPYDCAGGFKSEGLGITLLEKIEGDDPNALIGLPLIKLTSLLNNFGVSIL